MLGPTEFFHNSDKTNYMPDIAERLKIILLDLGFDPNLCIHIKSEWASVNEDYRLKIRENLYNKISQNSTVSKGELSDLSRIPEHSDCHISISHCRTFGGYTYIPKPHIIGFDVESLQRVTNKIANRISNPKDNIDSNVNPAIVWVAKEAAFKAIQNLTSIKVIQEVIIHSWSMKSSNIFEFEIGNLMEDKAFQLSNFNNILVNLEIENSRGCVIFEEDSAFAFYLLNLKKKGEVS
jgi:phosphopantetheinyl transferase (holo-ACP synthase)